MDSITKQSFSINLNIMAACGLYPPEKPTRLYKIQAWLMYFLLTYPTPTLGVLYFLFEQEIDMMRIGDNAFLVTQTGCQIMKLLPFITSGYRIKKCVHYFESPIFQTDKNKHNKILKTCIQICRRNSWTFFISVIGGNITWALKPLLLNERRLPVDVWLPFSSVEKTSIYCSAYAILVTGVAYVSIASAAIDPLVGGLACLAAGYLQILKDNLQNLKEYTEEPPGEDVKEAKIIKNKLRECVKLHNEILSFVKEYEHCFSFVVFSQFAGSVLVICFCCLQLSKIPPMSFSFISMIGYFTILLVQIYFYCYYGTMLYEESNSLTNAIYIGKWYEYNVEARKDLILMMERSKKPIVVTAGKVLELSVVTFTTILRRSYSLLAVLKNQ